MTNGFVVSEMTAADRPVLVSFMAALQDFERAIEPNRLPGAVCAEDHVAALLDWVAESEGGVLLAREGRGTPLGFILWGVEEAFGRYVLPENQRVGRLSDLYVVEEARGRGVGGALIAAAERRLAALGVRRVEITAVIGNRDAIAAYEALGYRVAETTLAKALDGALDASRRAD